MLKRFAKDERGNFAVFTGLMAVVLIGGLGGVIDLSRQAREQSTVLRAADAASLAGAKELEFGTVASAQLAIQRAATANLPENFPPVTFQGTIDEAAGTVNVVGSGTIKPYFLPLMKINSLSIAAKSQALIQRKTYSDFYFLLDVSESMNIAASAADRAKMESITQRYNNRPCAFACHVVEPYWGPLSLYDVNKNQGANKARLRIDVLRDAANTMIDKILALNAQPGSLKSTRVATAGFGTSYMPGVGPTSDATVLKASIKSMAGNDHTNIANAIAGLNAQLKSQGKGTSFADSRKFAILVTDGVRDTGFGRSDLGPIDPALCSAIKSKGIDLAVLEIKYVNDPDRFGYFRDRVAWYYNNISPNLQSCASPGLYDQATDADQAQGKLLKMIEELMTVRRRLAS